MLKGLKPKVFVVENVTGMVKGHMKQVFLDIMKTLRECGYDCVAQVMNAKWYGVPQARQRVIIIGTRKDLKKLPGHPKPTTKPIVASAAIDDLPLDELRMLDPKNEKWRLWKLCSPGNNMASVHPKKHWFDDHVAHPFRPFPTILATGRTYHWEKPGRLSIPMVKRACSFPDDFKLFGKYTTKWARLGNGVPPKLMEAVAIHIRDNFLNGSNDKRNH